MDNLDDYDPKSIVGEPNSPTSYEAKYGPDTEIAEKTDAEKMAMLEHALQISQRQQTAIMDELVEWERFYTGQKELFLQHIDRAAQTLQKAREALDEARKDVADYTKLMQEVEIVINSEALVAQAMANGFMAMPPMDRLRSIYRKKRKEK